MMLDYVSPSQISTFRLCALKWWFDKVAGLPKKPTGKGATLGGKMHAQLEEWLKSGGKVDHREALARGGDDYLKPLVGLPGLQVERELKGPALEILGVPLVGYIDLIVPFSDRTLIIDHKFRADVEKYAPDAEALRDDPQAVLYSAWAWQWRGLPVEFRHHNYQTQGRKLFRPVSVHYANSAALERGLGKIKDTVAGMCVAAISSPESITPNVRSCGAYGGCDFADVCPYSPRGLFKNKQEELMSLAKQFAAKTDANREKAKAPTKLTIEDIVDEGILPPDAPASDPALASAGPKGSPEPTPAEVAETLATIIRPANPVAAEAIIAEAEAKPKRPRAAKAKTEPAPTPEAIGAPAGTPGLTLLLIDCLPVCTDSVPLAFVTQMCADTLAKEFNVNDIRNAPKESPLAYGGWRSALASRVWTEIAGKSGIYTTSSRGELAAAVIERLEASTDIVVIRGVV